VKRGYSDRPAATGPFIAPARARSVLKSAIRSSSLLSMGMAKCHRTSSLGSARGSGAGVLAGPVMLIWRWRPLRDAHGIRPCQVFPGHGRWAGRCRNSRRMAIEVGTGPFGRERARLAAVIA